MGIKTKVSFKKIFAELIMFFVILGFIIPVWMVITNSLKTAGEANKLGLGLPKEFHFENYLLIFQQSDAFRALLNGLYIASVVGIITMLITSMAAFYISRSKSKFARFSYNFIISGLFIPVAIVPTYFTLLEMKLNNTYTGLILIFITYTIPLSVFLYTGFMKTIPRDMDEAAIVDGCGRLRTFFQVVFPLLLPVTMTVVIFNFVGVWNDVMTFLYFAGGDKWTLPMTVYIFFGKYSQNWNLVFADIVFTIIPCLLVYILGQKYVVSGMTAGAVKG